jgi:hypothetical protein
MKNRTFAFSFVVLPIAALLAVLLFPGQNQREYSPRDIRTAQTITGAAEYWNMIRSNQITGTVDPADVARALEDMKKMTRAKSGIWDWQEMGPDNLGGRTRAIIFDRNDPNTMYAGAVSGGLWKSTTAGSSWIKVESVSDNMIIASMTQAPNGDIYVGTGEGFYPGFGVGTRGFNGIGIYKSTDGVNFVHLAPTQSWTYVNNMAVHPTNGRVYAATNVGIKASDDNGATWNISMTFTPNTPNINGADVEIASDGTVYVVMNRNLFRATNGVDFTRMSGTGTTLPTAGSRMEIAVAPSDPNYIYAVLAQANQRTQGAWRSTDKGDTWTQIAPAATTTFDIHRNQGEYNNAVEVYPNNKDKIIVGGIDIWTWEHGGTWTQITSGNFVSSSSLYVHVDIHEFAFHPTNPNIIFVGCDGGIHRSTNGGVSWVAMNKNYSTIQYYAITSSGSGQLMGGTQDNSYQFIDFKGNTPGAARTVWGGDGGYAAISQINPDAHFVASQYGAAARTVDNWQSFQKAYRGSNVNDPDFFNARMLAEGVPGTTFAHFVTPLALWETVYAFDSKDSIPFVADTTYLAGEVITLRVHRKNDYPIQHTLLAGLNEGDTMMIQNPIQSVFVIAARNAVWMTRDPLNFSGTPEWFKLGATTGGDIINVTFSNDGDHLFAGTSGGNVFRFSNLRQAYDSLSADMGSTANPNTSQIVTRTLIANYPSRAITSIAVDPSNTDHVVVTLGNYGNNVYVYRSTDATSAAPTFQPKQGTGTNRLPLFPVYSALIPMHRPNVVIVGTEYGTYMTENITAANPVWVEANTGMDRVPTLMLHQQTTTLPYTYIWVGDDDNKLLIEYPQTANYGGIYVGTHGRGAFRNLNFIGIEKAPAQAPSLFRSRLLVYPNPVESHATAVINLSTPGRGVVRVYDLQGRVVATLESGMLQAGRNEMRLQLDHLRPGTYVVQMVVGNESTSAKIIKK